MIILQDVIDRVQNLEAMGHITGVMDDRGKVGVFDLRLPITSTGPRMSEDFQLA